jgi:anthranilate/para-aminobenzoate synthase component I
MEKRISCSQFMIVKNVAKAIDPVVRQKATIQAKINNIEEDYKKKEEEEMAKLKQRLEEGKAKKLEALNAELQAKDGQIEALESGVVKIVGFHVTDLVKKVMEPNGKTDDKGNPVKVTKFLPTDMVSYDEQKKEYVITTADEEPSFQSNEATGSDAVATEGEENSSVADKAPNEQETEGNNLPWDN